MIVYCINPIDFWDGWLTEEEFKTQLEAGAAHDARRATASTWAAYLDLREKAQKLALKAGWEGDIREGPFVAGLPSETGDDGQILVAWKQDNDGITFVATPFPLPWLARICLESVAE